MSKVSRNAPTPTDRQRAVNSAPKVEVGLAMIRYSGLWVTCSCGWEYGHIREKVREDAIDRHLGKSHGGMGVRL